MNKETGFIIIYVLTALIIISVIAHDMITCPPGTHTTIKDYEVTSKTCSIHWLNTALALIIITLCIIGFYQNLKKIMQKK